MPNVEHTQSVFRGELSSRLKGRTETQIYKDSLDYDENWMPTPQGSILMRPGMQYLVTPPDVPRRAIRFRTFDAQDYAIVLSDFKMRVYDVTGGLQQADISLGGELLLNWAFSSGGDDWTLIGTNANANWTLQPGWFTIGLNRGQYNEPVESWGTIEQAVDVPTDGDFQIQIQHDHCTFEAWIGTTPGGSEVDHFPNDGLSADGYATWTRQITIPAPGTYYFRFKCWARNTFPHPQAGHVDSISLQQIGQPTTVVTSVPTPWAGAAIDEMQYVFDTGANRIYLVHPVAEPQILELQDDGSWVLASSLPLFTSKPTEWVTGSWPGVVELYQSRLYLSGSPSARNRIWASRPGDPFNFSLTDNVSGTETVTAACAIDAKLSTKGAVLWIRGRQMLLVGTDIGEFSVTAANLVVTPLDLQVRQESAFGSAAIQAEDIGTQVVYVSGDRRKIRAIDFSHETQSYLSHDLTFTAEHITQAGVKEVHFARDPNCQIVVVMQDGSLVMATYDRGEQVLAWWRCTTNGQVKSASVSDGPQGSAVFLLVQRASGSTLELMPTSDFWTDTYLDAAIQTYALKTPVDGGLSYRVEGLDHLEGQQVRVVMDGAVDPDTYTVQSGTITLGIREGDGEVVVGLPYPQVKMRTLPPVIEEQRGASSQRSRRRWVKLYARLNDSALPIVNGRRIAPDRHASTLMGYAESRFTGDVGPGSTGDYDARGMVEITQDVPVRTEVLSIFGSLAESEV